MFGTLIPALLGSSDAYVPTLYMNGRTKPNLSPIFQAPACGTSIWRTTELRETTSEVQGDKDNDDKDVRSKLRRITGFSLTAFRSTWRAATGVSLTAVYASAIAVSGLWIRQVMSTVLSITPAWFRYFLQPFLVLYYAPLFIVRGLTGPTRKEAKAKHELIVDGWKEAIEHAENKTKNSSWPAHVNGEGEFELDGVSKSETIDSQKLADAVAESIEQASEQACEAKGDLWIQDE